MMPYLQIPEFDPCCHNITWFSDIMPLCQEIVCVGEVEQFDGGSEVFKKQDQTPFLTDKPDGENRR
jgi:hypothetical protein